MCYAVFVWAGRCEFLVPWAVFIVIGVAVLCWLLCVRPSVWTRTGPVYTCTHICQSNNGGPPEMSVCIYTWYLYTYFITHRPILHMCHIISYAHHPTSPYSCYLHFTDEPAEAQRSGLLGTGMEGLRLGPSLLTLGPVPSLLGSPGSAARS